VEKLERDIRRERILGKQTHKPTLLHFFANKPLAAGTDASNEEQRVTTSSLNHDSSAKNVEDHNGDSFSSSISSVGALSDAMGSSNDIN
jgi:hypothetical protein